MLGKNRIIALSVLEDTENYDWGDSGPIKPRNARPEQKQYPLQIKKTQAVEREETYVFITTEALYPSCNSLCAGNMNLWSVHCSHALSH